MSTANTPMYEWSALPWKKIQRRVFKLQKRIYQASQRGDAKTVHRLQKLLTKSRSARLLAVRTVTQDNRGKKTAGVDGVKSLTPPQRLTLATDLRLSPKARPVRRVWIPKPGTDEERPLGIPTMRDRAAQALAKLALEPEWEARFEPNTYGFRPGRSCHDAIEAIWGAINQKAKYVLDADIAKCFDRIDHQALLRKLRTFPALRRAIRAWLRAGAMDGLELSPTTEGTPQGGVISPLLANVALHGLEAAVRAPYPRQLKGHQTWKPVVIRYADDFVVLHENLAVIEEVKQLVAEWLAGMGLELKPSKTRITHTLFTHEGDCGFDFLGWHVRQFPVGKSHSARRGNGRHQTVRLGFKTLIRPSKEAQRRHYDRLVEIIDRHRAAPQAALIDHLNPVVRGWARYHSTVASGRVFQKMRHRVYVKLQRWAKRRHPKKRGNWVSRKYWRLEAGHWDFATKDDHRLYCHTRTAIQRHVKVRGDKSPYDGDWVYWASRLGHHPELPRRVAKLLNWQKGRCAACGLYFGLGDLPEVDHAIPLAMGGRDGYGNWQLVHAHCHDDKTARDGSLTAQRTTSL
jgi:RNA-directed DNA polymerase